VFESWDQTNAPIAEPISAKVSIRLISNSWDQTSSKSNGIDLSESGSSMCWSDAHAFSFVHGSQSPYAFFHSSSGGSRINTIDYRNSMFENKTPHRTSRSLY
jgi:hypothetical protein